MAFIKKRSKAPSWTSNALPIGAAIAALAGLVVAYLRWFRPGVSPELAGARPSEPGAAGARTGNRPAATEDPRVEALAGRFHGLDNQHAATHYPPSLERDPKNIEQSIHEG